LKQCYEMGAASKLIKKLFLSVSCIIILVLVTGCSIFPDEEEVLAPPVKKPPEVEYHWVEVGRGTIVQEITCNGYFEYVHKRDLSFDYRMGPFKSFYAKKGDIVRKGDLLAELDMEDIKNKIDQQEIALKKLEIDYASASSKNAHALTLEKISIDIKIVKTILEDLERDYERGRIVAPMDGEVDYVSSSYKEGDRIDIGWTIIRIADTSNTQLIHDGRYISSFKVGDLVDVRMNGSLFTGEVTPPPDDLPAELLQNAKSKVYIKLRGYDEIVPVGTSANIRKEIAKRENVVRIPRSLIRASGTRKYVNLFMDGLRKEQDVEVGIESADYIEIISGLKEGDRLFTN